MWVRARRRVAEAVGLTQDVGVEGDSHDQGLVDCLVEHLVDIVDDHVGEGLRTVLARDDGRVVVDLLRVGNGQEPAAAGAEPDGLVVHAPVERVSVAGLDQKVELCSNLVDEG
jgi:hypothetical protein